MPVLRLITSAAQKGHERFIRTLVAAAEIPQDYQFSAFTASVCCIAMRRRERGLLWVMGRPRKSSPALHLCVRSTLNYIPAPGALANFRLCANKRHAFL